MTALCSGKICTIFPEKGALNFWKACTIALEYSVFYILCVALNFCSESMVNMIVFFLNRVSTQNICLESYEMLYFNVLTPIKEAILTYIIFDVVFEKKRRKYFRWM